MASHLGEFPTLDAHLDLLDARGGWYAERALGAWASRHPEILSSPWCGTWCAPSCPYRFRSFLHAYSGLEQTFERRSLVLPPIDARAGPDA